MKLGIRDQENFKYLDSMDKWAEALYGNPCRECSFDFGKEPMANVEYIANLPTSFDELLGTANGKEKLPELSWTVSSYVCHVADNLRIWAERLAGVIDAPLKVGPYDENALSVARLYSSISLQSALWSLRRATRDLLVAATDTTFEGVVIVHPERGTMEIDDVTRAVAHDAFHHAWDIGRALDQ